MKKNSIVLLLMMLACACLYGQEPDTLEVLVENIGMYHRHIYSYYGEKIPNPDQLFADTPAEYSWQKGIKQQKTGTALLISAGALTACGIIVYGVAISGLDTETGFAGLGIMGASLPFYAAGASLYAIGKKNKQQAVNTYNLWRENLQVYLGTSPMGLQCVVRF
ncbi:MAG: hypothetical protein K6F29_10015 [Bacteroidales bacterium]|nr:hypothetical protein [Bacteroidales bacterium]